MTEREFSQHAAGHTHHHAIFHLRDGTTREGYMQPNDSQAVYLTALDGTSGGKILLEDIQSVEFPEG